MDMVGNYGLGMDGDEFDAVVNQINIANMNAGPTML